jgi:hypothetical protein
VRRAGREVRRVGDDELHIVRVGDELGRLGFEFPPVGERRDERESVRVPAHGNADLQLDAQLVLDELRDLLSEAMASGTFPA